MGSNMAENHPVAFRWVMKAKEQGAKLIHVDPRFTRTSALADIYAPIRTGSDIAFLGGLIRYVIENNKYFHEYVVNYTNAATIVNEGYQDAEDLDGVFSGLMQYTGDPINGFLGTYDNKTWQYRGGPVGDQGRSANTAQSGEQGVQSGQASQSGAGQQAGAGQPPAPGSNPTGTGTNQTGGAPGSPPSGRYDDLVRSLLNPLPQTDPTLQDPLCVFQIVRRHFSRYTPDMVERVTGCPQ